MIKVIIPDICKPEVKYVFHCLLSEFLGIDYKLTVDVNQQDFIIELSNAKVIIKNCFFTDDDISKLYIKEDIPEKINEGNFVVANKNYEVTCLFGEPNLVKENTQYRLDVDIIAATFFMLSRWEEFANSMRDDHNRFEAKSSLAFKEGFLDRPIVNEYVELLWALLLNCGYKGKRKKRSVKVVPTHDVDSPYMWQSNWSMIKSLGRKFYTRKYNELINNSTFAIKRKDPYDTHQLFMDLSEKANVKSHFFFMTGGDTKYDNRYKIDDERIVKLISTVLDRGHEIGLHPSYNSFNKIEYLKEEKERLEQVVKKEIKTGRQHYLRFSISDTWRCWNNMNMDWDSTLSYADCSGFRAGVCYPFPVYDIQKRKTLKLIERPLIVMEASIILYEGLSLSAAREKVRKLKEQVTRYNGEFVFLWHNSSFNTQQYIPFESLIYSMYGVE